MEFELRASYLLGRGLYLSLPIEIFASCILLTVNQNQQN
jgi:hypothetical protein